jgi:hypothetical protein
MSLAESPILDMMVYVLSGITEKEINSLAATIDDIGYQGIDLS